MMGFRAEPKLRAAIVKWAENQPDMPSLSEATRRLVELGLTVKNKGRPKSEDPKQRQEPKQRAREMAGNTIDRMIDTSSSSGDQASRKRRLLKGPEEFQNVRRDRPNRK
jgi:hypothetical protein